MSGWRRIGEGDPDRVVLAVDYDSTARPEAGYPDLAGLLSPSREMWLTGQPEKAETGLVPVEEYLDAWRVRPAGRVAVITGYCVGCVFAPALADAVAAEQGSRPALLLVDPEPVVNASLARDFRNAVGTMSSLSTDERAGYAAEAEAACSSTEDFTVAAARVLTTYEAAAGVAFERIGFDEETTEDIVGVFRSYVSYLAAAWQLAPETGWAGGLALTSAGSSPGAPHAGSEQTFPVGSAEMLADEQVAAAVHRFLTEQGA